MSYEIKITPGFKKSFKKLDFIAQRTISKWIVKNLEATDNPRLHGKALSYIFLTILTFGVWCNKI